jgi:hypothetical protein
MYSVIPFLRLPTSTGTLTRVGSATVPIPCSSMGAVQSFPPSVSRASSRTTAPGTTARGATVGAVHFR